MNNIIESKVYKTLKTELYEKYDKKYFKTAYDWKQHLKQREQNYLNLRKEYVDGLLAIIMKYLQCTNNFDCKIDVADGASQTIISDYDITLMGVYSVTILELFYDVFLYEFGMKSSSKFDTNVYATSFYHDSLFEHKNMLKIPVIPRMNIKFISLVPINTYDLKENQRVWAFIKLIMHSVSQKAIMNSLNTIHQFKLAKRKFNSLKKETNKNGNLYIEKVKHINKFKQELQNTKSENYQKVDENKLNYIDSISNATFFADELYFTQGSFIIVVGLLQSKYCSLTKYLNASVCFDSFIENFGEFLKNTKERNMNECLVMKSKYLARIHYSLYKYHTLKKENDLACYNEVVYKFFELIRSNLRGNRIKKVKIENDKLYNILKKKYINRLFIEKDILQILKLSNNKNTYDTLINYYISIIKSEY